MSIASFGKEAFDIEISFIQVLLREENHWHEENIVSTAKANIMNLF